MRQASGGGIPGRSDRRVRRAAAAWRELTGGRIVRDPDRRTLIACSGGADSSALTLALRAAVGASAGRVLVVAHVVHDLRPAEEALADRDAARALAERLGLSFVEARVRVKGARGNAEAAARRARYRALVRLARAHGCPWIATGHHADDQAETILMRLMRGAGAGGLRGVHASRAVARGVAVVRPMLGLTREECRGLCRDAGVAWAEDRTNADESRLRSAVRHRVLPVLEEIRPGSTRRAARAARTLASVHEVVRGAARAVLAGAGVGVGVERVDDGAVRLPRGALRGCEAAVVAEVIRLAAEGLGREQAAERRATRRRGADRLSASALDAVVRAVRSSGTEPRVFTVGGLEVWVRARTVEIGRAAVKGSGRRGRGRAG